MKIATWNVNSLKVRLPQVLDWLQTEQPDVLALQEIKMRDADFPAQIFLEAGYHAYSAGQKTYNGVALLTRDQSLENVITELSTDEDPQRRVLTASWKDYRIINLYVPNGEALDSPKYQYKLNWLKNCRAFLTTELQQHSKIVVLGDFNIAPNDLDVCDPKTWQNSVLVSAAERAVFQDFLELGFVDIFRHVMPDVQEFSWWDYRAASFRRNLGLRIDHILVSPALRPNCQRCWIDKKIRGLERPSDHAPVVAEFVD